MLGLLYSAAIITIGIHNVWLQLLITISCHQVWSDRCLWTVMLTLPHRRPLTVNAWIMLFILLPFILLVSHACSSKLTLKVGLQAIHVATWVMLLNMVLSVNIASYIDTRFWICSHLLWTSSIDRSLHSLSCVQDPHKREGVHSRIGGLATTEYFPTCDSKWPLYNWGRTTKKRITFNWPHFIAGIRFCVSHLYFHQFLELLYQISQYRKMHSPWTSYHSILMIAKMLLFLST